VGAGANKQVLLVVYGTGWHRAKQFVVPQDIYLKFFSPYSPELQPAEHLWQLSDESLVNRKFESLDALEEALATRCNILSAMLEAIRQHTLFHWWKEV
jgi:transposase